MGGKPKSCTACRQAKVACDAPRKAPDRCTRCAKKEYQCRFDNKFRRIATRQIAREITHEHLQISRNPQLQVTPGSDATEPSEATSLESLPAASLSFSSPHQERKLLGPTCGAGHVPFMLGNVAVSPDTIMELLRHFEHFHFPHATCLQPIYDVYQFAANSPLLFWTIVLIACEHHPRHSSLYAQILLPHHDLLAPISNSAIQSVEEVHAILLLCIWPFVQLNPSQDPSWSYIGIATSYCIKMNYHKAASIGSGSSLSLTAVLVSSEVKYLTLLACFTISTHISMFLGFEPLLASPHHMRYIKKAALHVMEHLTPNNKANIAIAEVVCNYVISLEDVNDTLAKVSLARVFDDELNAIQQNAQSCWTSESEVVYQYAKLNLYAAVMMAEEGAAGRTTVFPKGTHGFLFHGFDSASSLIRHMHQFGPFGAALDTEHTEVLQHLPRVFFNALFFAAIFLFRFIINVRATISSHKLSALNCLMDICKIFRQFPNHRDAARAAGQVEDLVARTRSSGTEAIDPTFPSLLAVTDRLESSVMWDTIVRCHWRENGVNGQVEGFSGPLEDMLVDRLPPPPEVGSHMMQLYLNIE